MMIFNYVLILLAAVLLSNLVNRFIPVLSVPFVQIILGVLIALIPFGAFGFEFELEPELFFVLFISPLVFHSSMTSDKKMLWDMKRPIIGAAIILVIITVGSVGYFVHIFIPAIPLAAAFALIAALGPTDDVAVDAVAKRVSIPRKIMGILTGESIINDASAIVCFQFAVAAVVSGSFSAYDMGIGFLKVGIGGILAGVILTAIKYVAVRWLRRLGVTNTTLHLLIGILTPFIIYMIAESSETSGILAVFVSGIIHSFMRDKFNPETVKLNIAQESVWSALSFTFDGVVFVILGTQLPDILKTLFTGSFSIGAWQILAGIVLLTLAFTVTRFLWWFVAVRKKTYFEPDQPIGKIKSAVLFSLSGARGTVTLASVMSIPLVMADGNDFPERDLLILIASGVIVLSLVITNFILPLFVKREDSDEYDDKKADVYAEIIRAVIERLRIQSTEETAQATEFVLRNYYTRSSMISRPLEKYHTDTDTKIESEKERTMQKAALEWERENTLRMMTDGETSESAGKHIISVLDTRIDDMSLGKKPDKMILERAGWIIGHWFRFNLPGRRTQKSDVLELMKSNTLYALTKLKEIRETGGADDVKAAEAVISRYEMMAHFNPPSDKSNQNERHGDNFDEMTVKIAETGFQIERELIQEMFEAGRISREAAKEMRSNIAAIEAELQDV